MIDTIILNIPKNMFRIDRPELFSPNCEAMLSPYNFRGKPYVKAVQNPTKKDLEYKPRLTLFNRPTEGGRSISLKVEFSAPKLMFGNNFDELSNSDFNNFTIVLSDKLRQMGVIIPASRIPLLPVSAIHYSKNIVLNDFTSASMIISELSKINLTERLDLSTTDFRNGGHCLRYHANSFELVFYDKVKDLLQAKKSGKRAVEKDNSCQMDIFEAIRNKNPFEVLRMEMRLCKRSKLKEILGKIGITQEPILKIVFDEKVAQRVLKLYWKEVDEGLNFFAMDASDPFDLLEGIKKIDPSLRPRKIVETVGAILLIQSGGVKRFRTSLRLTGKNSATWYALKKHLVSMNKFTVGSKYNSILKIPNALKGFTPLKLADYDVNYQCNNEVL